MVIKVEVDCKLVQGAYAQEISPLLDNIPIAASKVVLKIGEFFYCIFKWCVCSANSNWSSRRVESCGSSEFEGGRWLRFSGSVSRIELVFWLFGFLAFRFFGFWSMFEIYKSGSNNHNGKTNNGILNLARNKMVECGVCSAKHLL